MEGLGYVGILLIVVSIVLGIVAAVLNRRTKALKEQLQVGGELARELDVEHPRPRVMSFHVSGNEAQVTFDVPLGLDAVDPVLADMLEAEAIEVVRERRKSLPIDDVTTVVVYAGRGDTVRKVGSVDLAEPGVLPSPSPLQRLHLAHVGYDPLERQFEEEEPASPPEIVAPTGSDTLGPIGTEIRLPKAVEVGLRAQGIDPETMTAGELVRGVLRLFDYAITAGSDPDSWVARKQGTTTYIREDPYVEGDSPEVDESMIRSFMVGFVNAKTDRGILVSDKFAPFSIYAQERREPRVRFITRERLQKFVDSFALE